MKRIEIFNGSPRKNGNSAEMARQLVDRLGREKVSCNTTFLYDHEIRPCTDCRACKAGDLECVIGDEGAALYRLIEGADTVVVATPIYWFGPSAQTKLLVDRFRPYYGNKRFAGKQLALLLPAGSGEGDCDLTIEMFRRIAGALGMKYIGAACAKAYDTGEVAGDENARRGISRLASAIGG
ncbi:MAG TPA: NAD(P)H-dependent oxidoreductase [Candidatus Krumholzibacterium sp.]|nr:NAD(P)H-dependent oxidoreductase [Candidatus Krumholzibacterium sp.]